MREQKIKSNVQKQVYYKDRFYVAPQIPKLSFQEDEKYVKVIQALECKFSLDEAYLQRGTLVVWVDKDKVVEILLELKKMGYDVLSEMSAIDYLEKRGGFEIFYQLLNMEDKKRLRVKTFLKKGEELHTVSHIFKSANWSEREMYDMFGILPLNHPYPKRILMPDDWVGHPLLKSYPLHGDEHARWYEVDKIFGKEYREVIGEEQRDSARIDRYDSQRFSHLGYEVGYGESVIEGEEKEKPIMYQEEDGVLFVKKLDTSITKQLDKRK